MTTPTRKQSLPVLAIAREMTEDRKLTADYKARPVSVTHATQHSCHSDCLFRGSGCYAETGNQFFVTRRLNAAELLTDDPFVETAMVEAAAIDTLSGTHPLRLHIVGDCGSDAAAQLVSAAVDRYIARGQAQGSTPTVWTYTHAWRRVARSSWGQISVLASCETDDDVREATARGYACELTRSHADTARTVAGLRTIPCPQQTGEKADCASCLLCAKGDRLKGRAIIVLDPHGSTKKIAAAIAGRQ